MRQPQQEFEVVLNEDERSLLLSLSILPPVIASRMRFGLRDGAVYRFRFEIEHFVELADIVADQAEHHPGKTGRQRFAALYDRLREQVEAVTGATYFDPDDEDEYGEYASEDVTGAYQEFIEHIESSSSPLLSAAVWAVEQGHFATIEAAIKSLFETIAAEHNEPMPDFHGLTLRQINELASATWTDEDGALYVRTDYPASTLDNNFAVIAARTLLETADNDRGIPLTKTRRLMARKYVEAFVDAVPWGAAVREEWKGFRINRPDENNCYSLYLMRYWLEMAGLIRTYKGHLVCTKKGRRLIDPGQAPELLRELLASIFTKSNLSQFDPWFESTAIQAFTPSFIYGLAQSAQDWVWVGQAIDNLLPRVRMNYDGDDFFELAHAAVSRVIQPLYYCGLVEIRPAPAIPAQRLFPFESEYRVTPLHDLVFEFNVT